jgi:dihydroorotate dehydrogenase (NAD+) catalytic subunit
LSATQAIDLSLRIGSLTLANPVGTASGTYGKGLEFQPFYDVSRLGCVVVKTITSEPRAGNPPPRLVESPGGLLNSIGLPNPGAEAYIAEVLPKLRTLGAPLVINIAGHSVKDFAVLAARFAREEGIAALELNMSCPNVSNGLDYSTDPKVARKVLAGVRAETDLPLIAKLSPNVTDIRPIAVAAVEAGADAISAINTLVGLVVDWRARKPVALRIVRQLYEAVDVPIVGIGGIQDADDAMEFFLAGASAIQVGTANYYRPTAALDILESLPERIASLGASTLAEIVGTLQMP